MVKAAALLLACTGCSLITDSFATNDFSGDAYPTNVDTRSGAVLIGLRSGDETHIAVLDVLSPLTLIDNGPNTKATIDLEDLTLLGDRATNTSTFEIPRAAFSAQQVLRLHPCANSSPFCTLGVAPDLVEFSAIVGADALAGDALRLRLCDSQVFVLADVGGSDADRTYACDAVFPSPYRGGGTLVVAGTEVPFAGRRVTMQACLSPDPSPDIPQAARGTDALFVMSTSIGPSLISESAYERYRQGRPSALPTFMLPEATLALPSGPVIGRLTSIDAMALVARASSEPLAPCRQFYAHDLLVKSDCGASGDCPCEDGATFCPVPASVRVAPDGGIPMLVVTDDDATLQALRTEFRPSIQEIDGILGTGAIRELELDVDYPHNRVLARCRSRDGLACLTRPALDSQTDRRQIRGCPGITQAEVTPRAR